MLRLDQNTGSIVWSWQPVPYELDDDPDWTSTPSIMLTSCGALAVSTQKDGWTWAINTGNGTPAPPGIQWAFPTGPWTTSGFVAGDGTNHGDTRYLRPGAAWGDVYIVQTGGLGVAADAYDGFRHLYALNACEPDATRIRWIKDVPNSSGWEYSLGPPTVTRGIIFVGTDSGHLVVIADPSIYPADGTRCENPSVTTADCAANGFSLVPDPHVLNDIDLHAGAINTEPALTGTRFCLGFWEVCPPARGAVFVSTDGGQVLMLAPTP
jgi:outer membrane protein assembly factor BamB